MFSQISNLGMSYPPKEGDLLTSEDGTYVLRKQLGKGAFGYTYLASPRGERADVVIKFPKLDFERFDWEDILLRQEQIHQSFHNEINALKQLGSLPGIAQLRGGGASLFHVTGGVFLLPWLVYEYIEGLSLDNWMKTKIDAQQHYTLDASTWFSLAYALVDRLERIHQERVVHGDIWPPNIIIRSMAEGQTSLDPVIIDFGKSWLVDRTLDSAAEQKAWHPYWAPERFQFAMKTGRRRGDIHRLQTRWYAPADWYSLGVTLFVLATGPGIHVSQIPCPFVECTPVQELGGSAAEKKYIFTVTNPHYRRTGQIRDVVIRGLKEHNPSLYRQNLGIVDIIMSCIRPKVEGRIHHAHELRQLMEAFDHAGSRQVDLHAVIGCAKSIKQRIEASSAAPNSMFLGLVHNSLKTVEAQLPSLDSRVFVQTGNREALVATFVTFLSQLRSGDRLIAVTTSNFWRDPNMGSNGRALTMLRMAAERGAAIRWVVCFENYQKSEADLYKILSAHAVMMREYYETNPDAPSPRELQDNSDKPGLFLGHSHLSAKEFDSLIQLRHIAILVSRNGETILIAPDHSTSGGDLISLRFWLRPNRQDKLESKILTQIKDAEPAYGSLLAADSTTAGS